MWHERIGFLPRSNNGYYNKFGYLFVLSVKNNASYVKRIFFIGVYNKWRL